MARIPCHTGLELRIAQTQAHHPADETTVGACSSYTIKTGQCNRKQGQGAAQGDLTHKRPLGNGG